MEIKFEKFKWILGYKRYWNSSKSDFHLTEKPESPSFHQFLSFLSNFLFSLTSLNFSQILSSLHHFIRYCQYQKIAISQRNHQHSNPHLLIATDHIQKSFQTTKSNTKVPQWRIKKKPSFLHIKIFCSIKIVFLSVFVLQIEKPNKFQ